jgi:glycosyltransferase involved in cell wall biosynthesis
MLREVVCVPLDLPSVRSFRGFIDYVASAASMRPYTMAKYYRAETVHSFARLVQSRTFDLWLCDFVYPAEIIPWDAPFPKVIFAHNVEAQVWERCCRITRNPLLGLVTWREYHTMARAERFYVQKADHLLTVSEPDRSFFSQYLDTGKISVIPTGVDTDYFRPSPAIEKPNSLVFTGSMDWLPNEDGASYLLNELLPRIRSHIPDVTVCIAGRNPSAKIEALAARNGARITGSVPDIRPYISEAAVYLVPLRMGGGTRLKIFEAMAMGKAIVSTSIGAEGLPVRDGENILIRDNPDDFAFSIVHLLRSPSTRKSLGYQARRTVETLYTWESVAAEFDSALRKVVTRHAELVAASAKGSRIPVL